MQLRTKEMTVLAMLSAIAYLLMIVGRVPVVMFLKYDPKDVIIAIGGFLYGPLASFAMSFVVSFVEMFTASDTGPIGFAMNIIASCSFCCTAAAFYKKKRTMTGAVAGLVTGMLLATAVMLLWNYFLTPIYIGISREAVSKMLMPIFLPFNILKGSLNAAFTVLLYKPLKTALLKSGMMPQPDGASGGKANIGIILTSVFVIITCVLLILIFQGVL